MTLRPTRARTLLLSAAVAALAGYGLAHLFYRRLPELPRGGVFSLLLLALAEAPLAYSVRARLQGRPGTRPILPLVVARYAVLARASSLAGALVVGAWGGLAVFLARHRTDFRTSGADLVTALLNVAVGVLLVVAALLLERACRVPPTPPDPEAEAG